MSSSEILVLYTINFLSHSSFYIYLSLIFKMFIFCVFLHYLPYACSNGSLISAFYFSLHFSLKPKRLLSFFLLSILWYCMTFSSFYFGSLGSVKKNFDIFYLLSWIIILSSEYFIFVLYVFICLLMCSFIYWFWWYQCMVFPFWFSGYFWRDAKVH